MVLFVPNGNFSLYNIFVTLTPSHSSVNWGLIDVMSSIVDDLLFYLLLYYNYLLNSSSLPFVFMFFIEWMKLTLKLLAPQGWPMVVFPTFSTLKIVWPKPGNYGASSWNYLTLSDWKLSPGLWKYSPRLWKCWLPNSENAGCQILKMLAVKFWKFWLPNSENTGTQILKILATKLWKCWLPNSENADCQTLKMLTSPSGFPGTPFFLFFLCFESSQMQR